MEMGWKYKFDQKECRELSGEKIPEFIRLNTWGYMNLTQKSAFYPIESRALRPLFSPSEGFSGVGWYKDTRRRTRGRRRGRTHVSES